MGDDGIIWAPYIPVHNMLGDDPPRPDPIELEGVVELGGHIFVPGERGGWAPARITIDPDAHECRIDPQTHVPFFAPVRLVEPFWGIRPLNHRRGMYPALPEGTDMMGVRTNPPCSERLVDPDWTEEKGHGDYMARECCIAVYGFCIALPEGALDG